ncbi:MAG TPA: energy transducer TonB [Thermoanaerobaculia bacterium]|nr:energy transducer TonB [Thermoanaerobaculia bacterium]
MTGSVSSVLEGRLDAQAAGSFRRALVVAASLHFIVVLAAWVAPKLLAEPQPPLEFVAVRIVPAARLGVEQPKPVPPAPEAKAPEPEPVPEPKRESKAPALPDPKAKKEPAKPAPEPAAPATPQPAVPPSSAAQVQGAPTGALAGMALGAPVATFDNPDFTYGYYVDQMLAMISRNWTRPLVGGGVEAWIHFEIERDGTLRGVRISRSSGINSFDLAALRAVQASSPLPPLPRAYREDSLGVNLIVR